METWMMRGLSHLILGITSFDQRVNPEGLFEKAVADFDRAIDMSPKEAEPRTGRARAILVGAHYSRMMGRDLNYDNQYREAIRELDRALDLTSSRPEVWSMRGAAKVEYATYLRDRKDDPVFFYEGAVVDYEESLKLDPNWIETYVRLGMALTQWGVALEHMADRIPLEKRVRNPSNLEPDPLPVWSRGEKAFQKAVEIDEKWGEAWLRLGGVRMHVGAYLRASREANPVKDLRQAIEDINKAMTLGSRTHMTYWIRSSCYFNLGRHYEFSNQPEKCRTAYQAAIKDFETTARLNPGVKGQVEERIRDIKGRIK
jgi:tetratricopeptide (TPR) repeat protein